MENKMYTFMVIVASLALIYLSSTWLYSDIQTISTLWDSDISINWWLYVPLILFYIILFLISLALFLSHLSDLELKSLYQDSQFKQVFKISILLNIIMVVLVVINNFVLHIGNSIFIEIFIVMILFGCYLICAKKYNIHPFYYLFAVVVISFILWYPIFLFI